MALPTVFYKIWKRCLRDNRAVAIPRTRNVTPITQDVCDYPLPEVQRHAENVKLCIFLCERFAQSVIQARFQAVAFSITSLASRF